MPRSRWTLVLVPHDNERVRTFDVSAKTVRSIIATALVFVLLLSTFSIGFFVKQGQDLRASTLRQENALLAAEVEGMRGRMQMLDRSIDSLAERSNSYRAVAGLPQLGSAVRQAGIGGPGAPDAAESALARFDPRLGGRLFTANTDLSTLLRRAALLHGSMDQALHAMQNNREKLASMPSIAPSSGPLSSLFSTGRYHPVLHITRPHKGIDIAAPVGQPILAPAKGVVRFSGNRSNGYGNMVEIDHGFGYVTRFAHCSKLRVQTGDVVRRGQMIALVGATGLVSGPHLHYEVEVGGRQVDPLNFIIADEIPD